MLSISTSWNYQPRTNVKEWLSQVKEMGFEAIELGYEISRTQLAEFERHLQDLGLKVSSIHNFCPTPDDEPSSRHVSNYYRLSALNEHERQKAVFWTKASIKTAKRVGAGVVIVHAGTIDLDPDPSAELLKMFQNGEDQKPAFKRVKDDVLRLRDQNKGPYIEALKKSFTEVMGFAQELNIKIGLETRYYPIEIPDFDEIAYFLDLFSKQGMAYWHDVGHAEVNERLGIRPHLDFLNTYYDQMVGMHIHGVKGLRDHIAPFEGDMDCNKFAPFLTGDILKVIEARCGAEEHIKTAVTKINKI